MIKQDSNFYLPSDAKGPFHRDIKERIMWAGAFAVENARYRAPAEA